MSTAATVGGMNLSGAAATASAVTSCAEQPVGGAATVAAPARTYCAPINLIYQHFHNSIRAELDALSELARGLDGAAGTGLEHLLQSLRSRYQFMEQVYRYHSSVEDEVPALSLPLLSLPSSLILPHPRSEERTMPPFSASSKTCLTLLMPLPFPRVQPSAQFLKAPTPCSAFLCCAVARWCTLRWTRR